jgi:hypothetical protein
MELKKSVAPTNGSAECRYTLQKPLPFSQKRFDPNEMPLHEGFESIEEFLSWQESLRIQHHWAITAFSSPSDQNKIARFRFYVSTITF